MASSAKTIHRPHNHDIYQRSDTIVATQFDYILQCIVIFRMRNNRISKDWLR